MSEIYQPNAGRCPKCREPFDEHLLPAVILSTKSFEDKLIATPTCRPLKDTK